MPREYADHGAELDSLGAGGHVGEELKDVRAHRVISEVVLDAPDGVEAERFGQPGERKILLVDLRVRDLLARILKDD